jgi:phage recombination protein Bet
MQELQKMESLTHSVGFDNKQIQLFRELYCKNLTDDETKLFLAVCQRSGLDPTAKQVYAVKRRDWKLGRDVMTIQTSIDGYRLIAERTGRYAPGSKKSEYEYDDKGNLISATVYVRKLTKDGTWHDVPTTAFYDEYVQTFKDKQTGEDKPTTFWEKMKRNQLAKCAESLGIRKCFPQELSGIYTKDEMDQTDIHVKPLYIEKLSTEQVIELVTILNGASPEYQEYALKKFIQKQWNVSLLDEVPADAYEMLKNVFTMKNNDYQKVLADKEMTLNIEQKV